MALKEGRCGRGVYLQTLGAPFSTAQEEVWGRQAGLCPTPCPPTAHLVAAEDSGLLMVIEGLGDPPACRGFLGSQGLLWVTPPACSWAHLPRGHWTGVSILSTHSFSHRFLALCCAHTPILGVLFPPQTKCRLTPLKPEPGRHRPQELKKNTDV